MNTRQDAFEKRLDDSVNSVFIIAEYLHRKRFTVLIPGLKKRWQSDVPDDYVDDGDIFVILEDGTKWRVEVKGVTAQFTGAHDYPYKFMLISSKSTVERIKDKVERWVILAKDRQHFAIIHKDTQESWFEVELFASNTQKKEKFYAAPLDIINWHKIGD